MTMSQYLPFSPGHHLVLSLCEQILSPLMERGPCCTPIISATHQRNDFPLGLERSSELLWFHLTLLTCELGYSMALELVSRAMTCHQVAELKY